MRREKWISQISWPGRSHLLSVHLLCVHFLCGHLLCDLVKRDKLSCSVQWTVVMRWVILLIYRKAFILFSLIFTDF